MVLTKTHLIVASGIIFLCFLTLFAYTSSKRPVVRDERVERVTKEVPASATTTTASPSESVISAGVVPSKQTPVREVAHPGQGIPKVASTTPIAPKATQPQFPWKQAIATVFWAGEGESSDNGFIQNRASAWDEEWSTHFGGVDDPDKRCGYRPCAFVPKQNPFYVALPYIERNEDDTVKASARRIPWYSDMLFENGVLLKNHWVEVRSGATSCYGQWEDVGPFETDDFAYVFGEAPSPKNTVDARAGIDLSPAMRDCLKVDDVSTVAWRFVDATHVPQGPWTFVAR